MKDLTNLLEQLALKLGVTTEYLWTVLIRQAKISGVMNAAGILLIIVLGFILFKAYKYAEKKDLLDSQAWDFGLLVSYIIWAGMIIISPILFYNMITALMNPEYWALSEILDTLK